MNPRTNSPHGCCSTPEAATTKSNAPAVGRRLGMEEAMARAGVSERLLRQCEAHGLLQGAYGHRYTHEHVSVLRFARRAYALGFGMSDITRLLALRQNEHRRSAEVKRIALSRSEELESRIEELQATKRVLERLAGLCLGDHQPACPILDELLELKGFCAPAAIASA
ncbi:MULTISPECIES: MerR family DNA-binding protein [unclassified Variovorax]|uniref:MerR family DNA-binding protein n=1 Tax=unclassified Variovorax TaxID=663243 RepID=UPI000F7E56CD|nr:MULTISPECIES: MerR family DNA-binding protein [unclassified Variovorax]RSZ33213.1 MerR family transcriptional regulator [Variovorax sp. 553]RSZ33584.1 MerR family transcriptional regulator [Variovorax sp. 679]